MYVVRLASSIAAPVLDPSRCTAFEGSYMHLAISLKSTSKIDGKNYQLCMHAKLYALNHHQCKTVHWNELTKYKVEHWHDQSEVKLRNSVWLTTSSMEKPFVHLIRVPDAIDNCFTGKEKVKPNSLCLPGGRWKSSPSVATNSASAVAIKSNNTCN